MSIHLHRINNMGTSWSAVCCPLFVFKVQNEFPSEQLGSCSVARFLLLQILFVSLHLEIKTEFNVRFQGQAGPPQVNVSTLLQGWIGSLAARGPFWQFLVVARLSSSLSTNSSGKLRKHLKDCFSSTASAFQNLCRGRFWQQVLWSEVSVVDLLGRGFGLLELLSAFWEHLQAFWEPFDSHLRNTKTMHTRLYYAIPHGCEKQQQLSTSPSNHAIALGSSLYRCPWFR